LQDKKVAVKPVANEKSHIIYQHFKFIKVKKGFMYGIIEKKFVAEKLKLRIKREQ
jgi:hypothetical protein